MHYSRSSFDTKLQRLKLANISHLLVCKQLLKVELNRDLGDSISFFFGSSHNTSRLFAVLSHIMIKKFKFSDRFGAVM